MKADGFYGGGTLVRRGDQLSVVRARFDQFVTSRAEIGVPSGEVVVVQPYLALPWAAIALQLGGREAAVVPRWKRQKLTRMLAAAGREVRVRRTVLFLAVGKVWE